jgi:nitric oxide dioxygenase
VSVRHTSRGQLDEEYMMTTVSPSATLDLPAELEAHHADVIRATLPVIAQHIDDPSGVVTFVVEAADPADPLPDFIPGQYVSVGATLPDGARQLRQYSLVHAPRDGRLAFTVRPVAATVDQPAGEVSNWLTTHVTVGDNLAITLPFGDLTLDTAASTPAVHISAGIGITPMIGILEYLAAGTAQRQVLVAHADRNPDTHPLRTVQRDLVDALPNADLELWYEQPSGDSRTGTLTVSALDLPAEADIYLCGGAGFLQSVRAQLTAAGVPLTRVHFELFSPDNWLLR